MKKIIKTYEEYFSLIEEGLIKTFDIDNALSIIDTNINSWTTEYNIDKLDNSKFKICFDNSLGIFEVVSQLINNLGYYCSYMILKYSSGYVYRGKFDFDVLTKNETDIKNFDLTFESKFDEKINFVPEYLYHICKEQNIEKIKQIGLVLKSKKRITYHPDRIYFCVDFDDIDIIHKNFKKNDLFNNKNNIYYCLKIKNDNYILYNDPNFWNKGCYTYDNIKPINIIEYNKL